MDVPSQKKSSAARVPMSVIPGSYENVNDALLSGGQQLSPQSKVNATMKGDKNTILDSFTEDEASSSRSMRETLSSKSTGKRIASQSSKLPKKKRTEITAARDKCVGVKEGVDGAETFDEHGDDTSKKTVAHRPRIPASSEFSVDLLGPADADDASSSTTMSASSSTTMSASPPPAASSTTPPAAAKANFHVAKDSIKKSNFVYDKVDVGELFYQYQSEALSLINDPESMMSMENVDQFLSVNYIVDLTRSKAPMGLEAAYQLLKDRYQEPVIDITREQRDVCNEIESELAKTGQLGWRTYAEELCLLFKRLHSSIPRTPLESLNIGEDSFAHDSVDPFWRYQFLESNGYEIRWADTADAGSTARRGAGRGRKPDLSLKKSGHTVCHVEIKRPIKTRAPKAFLEDYFKLAMLCKDTIDEAGRQRCAARKCSAVQYHGHHMSVYTMTLDSGLYFWSLMGRCTIPIDRSQLIAVIPALRLLNSLELYTDSIEITSTSIYQKEEFRSSVLSPSKRKLF